ncbi:MAG: hypothetical protein MJ252_15280 [archaeon]|nr:hypothetical protein [archaeon]
MKDRILDPFTYKLKIIAMMLLSLADIFMAGFTQFINFEQRAIANGISYGHLISGYKKDSRILCYALTFMEMGLVILMLFVLLGVLSQTYYFKNGIISELVKVKSIVFAFLFIFIYIGCLLLERLIRGKYFSKELGENTKYKHEIEYDKGIVSIILLCLRYLAACMCYVWCINACFEMGKSRYYREAFY